MAISDIASPVADPLSSDEQRKILAPTDKWTNRYAWEIVKSDWAFAESYRTNAHDWRYRNADELYLGWVGQQYWEGTRVPRSSLPVYVVFGQVEAMLPKIVSSVTGTDAYHFTADQPGEDSALAVIAWRELVLAQLAEARWREQVRRAIKSLAIYGNGVLEAGVEEYEDENITFDRNIRTTKITLVPHPTMGQVPVPTASEEVFTRKVHKETKLRPYVRYVSVKDFYVNPNSESTCLQDAGYVIKRVYMTASQIKELGRNKDFAIPDDTYLTNLSHSKSTANQDVTKLSAELYRYNMWNPAQDYTSDPAQKRIAMVEYTSKDRKVWWLQGGEGDESIIYNKGNRYGQINYFSAQYADVLDRWHALSVSDVAEGDQRLQGAIINGRVDELALALHPPIKKKRGITVPWYQLKRAPGRVTEVEDPEKDLVESEIHNITQQAFVEVSASESRVQRTTGITDLAALGAPSSGGNSANRTATGINTQSGATQDRMRYLVENVEDNLIEPVVNFIIKCDRKFLDMKTASNWLALDPRFAQLDPAKVMNTRVTAECKASQKMAARAGFLQLFPMLAQTVLNPEFLQLMGQQEQMILNAASLEDMLMDAINYAPREPLFVKMSPQQIQAQSQPPPDVAAKLQMQDQQISADADTEKQRSVMQLMKAVLQEAFSMHGKLAELDDSHIQALMQMSLDNKKIDKGPSVTQ